MSTIPRELPTLIRNTNPFEYQGAIIRSDRFFDRKSELEVAMMVCQQIVRGSTGGVLVFGGRGSGKSSFLNALKRSLDDGKIACAKISLDEGMVGAGQEPRLFKLILNDLTVAADTAGLLEKGVAMQLRQLLQGIIKVDSLSFEAFGFALVARSAQDQESAELPYAILRDGFKDLIKLLKPGGNGKGAGAVLVLDEGDALTGNRVLLQVLRNVFQESPGMGLVIAGTSRLLSEVSSVFSPIPRFFRKIDLGPFPTDADVEDAILKTIQLAKNDLLSRSFHLDVIAHTFIPQVTELSGRVPLDFNMLSCLAYEIGSAKVRYENGVVTLPMRLDRAVLEQAMRQLRGTKEYAAFLDSLSERDRVVLRLLSKCPQGASIDELAALLAIDDMGENLGTATIDQVISHLDEIAARKQLTEDSLKDIALLGEKFSLRVLIPDLADRPIYRVEDQWVRAYFKYTGVYTLVALDLGLISRESGILIFGDPISSILDSVFLHKVIQFLERPDPFRVNSYPNDGMQLGSSVGRILNMSFTRVADGNPWHLAFHLKLAMKTSGLVEEITRIMDKLRSVGLLKNPSVRERVLNHSWS